MNRRSDEVREALQAGMAIPAHPLALTAERKLDEIRQKALTRYYLAAGAGGVAVGVHTTQFGIHDPERGLLRPVLELCRDAVAEHEEKTGARIARVAGIVGSTEQAVREAAMARELDYDCGLLSLGALRDETEKEILRHCAEIGAIIPLFGFYLQPAVGGRDLPHSFWRRFVEIPAVVAIKVAPFDRYKTLDVIRAVAESGRIDIPLYTGNDDSILSDLTTSFDAGVRTLRFAGGLLGQWAVWTRTAVLLFREAKEAAARGSVPVDLLKKGSALTDCNGAIFDARNNFAGCIAGIHEILRRQGLLEGLYLLDPAEGLSPGQREEIDRVCLTHPELNDDAFVAAHRDEWLRP